MAVTPTSQTTDQTSSPDAPSAGPDEVSANVETSEAVSTAEAAAPSEDAVLSASSDAMLEAAPDVTPVAPSVQSAIADEIQASEAQAALKRRQMEARASHTSTQDGFSLRTRPPRVIAPPKRLFWKIDEAGVLVARITVAACLGLAGGSLGVAGVTYLMAQRDAQAGGASAEEVRSLRETVAQLRAGMKTLNDQIAGLRSTADSTQKTTGDQITQLNDHLDRLGRAQAAAAGRLARTLDTVDGPEPEATGSLPPASSTKPVISGWTVRRAYEDTAILEGRAGVVQVSVGQDVPGIGRIQEIRRQQSGRWVIIADKGVIVSTR